MTRRAAHVTRAMAAAAWAVLAGFCAALASVFAKLAVDVRQDEVGELAKRLCRQLLPAASCAARDAALGAAGRAACVALVVASNAAMWALFTRALGASRSSVHMTVLSSASNLFWTSVCGLVLLGEVVSPRWCLGSVVLTLGVVLMHRGMPAAPAPKQKSG